MKQKKFILSWFQKTEFEIKVSTGLAPSGGPEGESFHASPLASGGCQTSVSPLACKCTPAVAASAFTWRSSLHVSVALFCPCLALKRTPAFGSRVTLNPGQSHLRILNSMPPAVTLFQIRSYSQVPGLGLGHIWGRGGGTIQPLLPPCQEPLAASPNKCELPL